jgi:S1-C subfamily serine protease
VLKIIIPDSTITVRADTTKLKYKDTVDYQVKDRSLPTQIVAKKDGYITQYLCLFRHPDSSNCYAKAFRIPEMQSYPRWNEGLKRFFVKNGSMNVEDTCFKIDFHDYHSYFRNKAPLLKKERGHWATGDFGFLFDFRDRLEKTDYVDTTKTILIDNTNTVVLDCSIRSMKNVNIYDDIFNYSPDLYKVQIGLDWYLENVFGDTLMIRRTNEESSLHKGGSMFLMSFFNILNEVLDKSFFTMLKSDDVKEIFKKDTSHEQKFEPIIIKKPFKAPKDVDQAIQASVTIKTKSGIGSGFIISNNGYIVTNYNIVACKGDVFTVVTHDGSEYQADLIRSCKKSALTLLKMNTLVDIAFELPDDTNLKITDDIFAIGTPTTLQMGQTVTKGVVSAIRNQDDMQYIQIDASVCKSSCGGPILRANGELVGVANLKLSGLGLEGLSFAIPASRIKKDLMIGY